MSLSFLKSVLAAVRRFTATGEPGADQLDTLSGDGRALASVGGGADESEIGQPQALEWPKLTVDYAWKIPELGIFLIGWCLDPLRTLSSISAELEGGDGRAVSDTWIRIGRDDVVKAYPNQAEPNAELGFFALVRGTPLPDTLALNVITVTGARSRMLVPAKHPRSFRWFVRALQGSYPLDHPRLKDIISEHIGPAINGAYCREPLSEQEIIKTEFGRLPSSPTVSLIIPLYGRADFMRYQLALMSGDPDLECTEIIYVVDDPSIYEEVMQIADGLCDLLSTAVRVVTCGRNLGYAGANNLGASVARGEILLLVNSDVMPTKHGWIEAILRSLVTLPDAGAVGSQLRYEDGSIQFSGMQSEPYRKWGGLLINVHRSKGFPADTVALEAPKECESITGAVLAIRKKVFESIGGMDEKFLHGDFEDSALCCEVRKLGLRCFVIPWCGLYHLERLSLGLIGDSEFRTKVTLVNSWRFSTYYHLQPLSV